MKFQLLLDFLNTNIDSGLHQVARNIPIGIIPSDYVHVAMKSGSFEIEELNNELESQRLICSSGSFLNFIAIEKYSDSEFLITVCQDKKMMTGFLRASGFEQRVFKDLSKPYQEVSLNQFIEAIKSLTKAS